MNNVVLYFGSFNPVHRGHIAVAEYVVERGIGDMVVMVVSPQNPFKQGEALAPELARFEMAEIACRESRYPDKIVASAIEFVLPRPSYTIDTLHYLAGERPDMRFSLLVGGDIAGSIPRWKQGQTIMHDYKIYMYPRGEVRTSPYPEITLLDGAPDLPISSTEIRLRLSQGKGVEDFLSKGVADYITSHGLWK